MANDIAQTRAELEQLTVALAPILGALSGTNPPPSLGEMANDIARTKAELEQLADVLAPVTAELTAADPPPSRARIFADLTQLKAELTAADPPGAIFDDLAHTKSELAELRSEFEEFTARIRAVFPLLGDRPRPVITPELRSILMLISDAVTPETSDDDLFANPDLGLELLSFPAITNWSPFEAKSVRRLLHAPRSVGGFFLECFAVDEPTETVRLFTKSFPRPRTLRLALPVPIPISVASENGGETLSFGFFDSLISADATELRVRTLLDTLEQRTVLHLRLEGVDARCVTRQALEDFSYKFDLRMLVDFTRGVRLLILRTEADSEAEREMRADLERLYDDALAAAARGGQDIERQGPLAIETIAITELADGERM
jgi:hypothetical protein